MLRPLTTQRQPTTASSENSPHDILPMWTRVNSGSGETFSACTFGRGFLLTGVVPAYCLGAQES
jgi:hypothetical protein